VVGDGLKQAGRRIIAKTDGLVAGVCHRHQTTCCVVVFDNIAGAHQAVAIAGLGEGFDDVGIRHPEAVLLGVGGDHAVGAVDANRCR